METAETEYLLKAKGFSVDDAKKLTTIISKNKHYWVEFMMQHELELPNPEHENPILTGLATFISFVFFGFIPIIPYLFTTQINLAFNLSLASAGVALALLGLLRWKVTDQALHKALIETLVVGGISASIAFFVGTFFRG